MNLWYVNSSKEGYEVRRPIFDRSGYATEIETFACFPVFMNRAMSYHDTPFLDAREAANKLVLELNMGEVDAHVQRS